MRQFELLEPPTEEQLNGKSPALRSIEFEYVINSAYSFQQQGIIQSLIHSFKYAGMPKLATILGELSSVSIQEQFDFIVPVPLHRVRYSERGYNQSEKLAEGIRNKTGIGIANRKWFKRIRQTLTQANLNEEEREANVRGAFKLTESGIKNLHGMRILLIDDVLTTGATLASATKALIPCKPASVVLFAFASVVDNESISSPTPASATTAE